MECRLHAAAGDCATLRHQALSASRTLPAAFAFGSAEPAGEWRPVLVGWPQLSAETMADGCRGLVITVHWRVLVARAGSRGRVRSAFVCSTVDQAR